MLEVFNTLFWRDVVWALIHSVWQAAIIALLLGIILRQISAKKASLRYWLAVSAIASLVLASFFTYHVRMELRNSPAAPIVEQASQTISSSQVSNLPAAASENAPSSVANTGFIINWTALAALFWLIGVSTMVLRTISAVFHSNRLSFATPVESSEHLKLLKEQSGKLGLRKVPSFWICATSHTPYVVGVLAPALVVPLSMLTSLSSVELQAVLAHELAHIRRNDYLANLFQMVVEAVYFFNPAVWWISRQIRVEREACCDQIAIASASNQVGYATILANWMETISGDSDSQIDDAPTTAMAFAEKQPSGMLERIQRILKPDSKPRLRVSPLNWVFVIAASILIACVMNVGSKAVTTVAVRALSDSERVAKIEEKQVEVDEHAGGVFEKGTTTIRCHITTEDGGEVERGDMHYLSNRAGTNLQSSVGRFAAGRDFNAQVSSGVVFLELYSKNYAPAIIGPIKAIKDQSLTQNITLVKGVPHLIHVVDEKGQPVSDANVFMYPKSHGGPVWEIATDNMGNSTFKHRNPGGESSMWVKKVGYITERMVVTNNGKTEVMLKTAPISKGVVLSADGEPVADAEIRLVKNKGMYFNYDVIATTDEHGRFETPSFFPRGIYEVLVVSDSGMAEIDRVTVSDDLQFKLLPACSMDITIKGDLALLRRTKNGKLSIGFSQRAGGELEIIEDSKDQVRVKIKRLLRGKFALYSGKFRHTVEAKRGNHSVEVIASAASDKEHTPEVVEKVDLKLTFECDGQIVKPGGALHLYHLGHYHGSSYPLDGGQLKMSVEPGKCLLEPRRLIGFTFDRQKIEVEAGSENEFTIEVEPAGAVSGSIVDVNGEPFSTSVSCQYTYRRPGIFGSGSLSNHFSSDDEGRFLLTPIPLGAEVVVTASDGFNPAISGEILIEASNPVVDVQLQTSPSAKAKVRVIDHKGQPMHGVDLSVNLVRGGSWSGSFFTDAKGEFEVTPMHPAWDYTVKAEKKGFVATTVDLVQGETNILQLEPGCVVRGQLLDKDGNPVYQERVYAQAIDREALPKSQRTVEADQLTDREGRFEFTKLSKAGFQINSCTAEPVIIEAGVDEDPIELRLKE